MGTFSRWAFTAKVTFWAPTVDAFGQPSAWIRSVFPCSFTRGGRLLVDDSAEQFMPKTVVWLEATDATAPKVGWKMKVGEVTDLAPPDDAETVRLATGYDPSTFNEGTPDRMVASG